MTRDNYSHKKYQKELARKKKQGEKLQRRLAKKNEKTKVDSMQVSNEDISRTVVPETQDLIQNK
ncbi:MAG: hypothetical protein ISS45_03810 [Candidatus Omnitrophica bacterium]|nr:hypothetical protein [Candidatus Omnitrophota bacterium]